MKKLLVILLLVFMAGCTGLGQYEFVKTDCNTDTYQCLAVWERVHPTADLTVRVGTTGLFNNCHIQAVADGIPLSVNKQGLQGVSTGLDEFYGADTRSFQADAFIKAYQTGLPISEALIKEFAKGLTSYTSGSVTMYYDPSVWKVN